MEITGSGVSVYEIKLDLGQWGDRLTNEVPGFNDALIALLPSTHQHKCSSGAAGGFHLSLAEGTNFGHVVEHVLLELIHLADPGGERHTGWTRQIGEGEYVVHFGAPDFLTGRLAAILAVDLVGRLTRGEAVALDEYLSWLADPQSYFAEARSRGEREDPSADPDVLQEIEDLAVVLGDAPPPVLTDEQRTSLAALFARLRPRLSAVETLWRETFFEYGGRYARGIVDKVEIFNASRFVDVLAAGGFDSYFSCVVNFARIARSLRIPVNFLVYAQWLFKNGLVTQALDLTEEEPEAQSAAVRDLDVLYQLLMHRVAEGYATSHRLEECVSSGLLKEFRARRARRGLVLIVDDDDLVRQVARDALELNGFETLLARDGGEALRRLAEHGDRITLALIDIVLPGLDGHEVCRRLRRLLPRLKVVLTSGYPLTPETERLLVDHEIVFLEKPFRVMQLIGLVRGVLDLEGAVEA